MIKVVDLYKSFKDQAVLRGVNLTIEEGCSMALIGGSGQGKSILLKHIIGLIRPDQGRVLIDNQDIGKVRGRPLKQLKERFGIVFQGEPFSIRLPFLIMLPFRLGKRPG